MSNAKYVNFNSNPTTKLSIGGNDSNSFFSAITGNKMNMILICVFILILIVFAFIYYYYYIIPQSQSYNSNNEPVTEQNSQGKSAELLFFYTDWCPHCKTAKPIWEEIKTEYENKTINGYTIIFTEIDCTDETEEVDKMMNKYNVEGYPTIKLLKDGQVIEYDAKPTKATIVQFLTTVL
jgi:thiol-disulfide isomerase/thioredoxin